MFNLFGGATAKMDFSQIEMQCAAHMAGDHEVHYDVYTVLASRKFGVPPEDVTPTMRKAAKDKMYQVMYS